MKVIKQSVSALDFNSPTGFQVLQKIERIGRTCYQSDDKITSETCVNFVKGLIKRKHFAMLEHHVFTFRWITDRGVSNELVRHRLASYAQESTRYCNYKGKHMEFILPVEFHNWISEGIYVDDIELQDKSHESWIWLRAMKDAEKRYNEMIDRKCKPQLARSVLPNGLKTEIIFTMNLRQLFEVLFPLRMIGTTGAPHPQIQDLATKTYDLCMEFIPEIFGELK